MSEATCPTCGAPARDPSGVAHDIIACEANYWNEVADMAYQEWRGEIDNDCEKD